MFEWLWNADEGLWLGAFGFVTAIASLVYARGQARGAKAQVEGARRQAVEALLAAQLVAKGARETAAEALRAAGLVAENARRQAVQTVQAAELLANSAVSARVREMRARNLRSNRDLPASIKAVIEQVGGPEAYSLMLDSVDTAQEIYSLRKRSMVSEESWRLWMDDQMMLIARSPSFKIVFHRAARAGALRPDFVQAYQAVFEGHALDDPLIAQEGDPAAEPNVEAQGSADAGVAGIAQSDFAVSSAALPARVARPEEANVRASRGRA